MIETFEDAKEVAAALLATVKKLMAGSEIEACEWTKTPEFEDEVDWYLGPGRIELHEDEDGEYESLEMAPNSIHKKWETLIRLETTFSREIGNWINRRNIAIARRSTKLSGVE